VQEKFGERSEEMWAQLVKHMDRIVIDSLKSVSDVVDNRPASFELYGYDFMIDEDLRPWLIEVNSSPDMSKNAPILKKIVFEAVDDLASVVLGAHNATTSKIKAMGRKRDAMDGECRWRMVHRGKAIAEKRMHRRFWLKKAEIDKHNAPRGLCHRHLLRSWLLCQSDEAAESQAEEGRAGAGWRPSERKVSEGGMWGLAKKTIMQKNREEAEKADKPVAEAKKISKADAAASAARLSKPREPKHPVKTQANASALQGLMMDSMTAQQGVGSHRGMSGGAMARQVATQSRVEIPISTMDFGSALGFGLGNDPLAPAKQGRGQGNSAPKDRSMRQNRSGGRGVGRGGLSIDGFGAR